MKGNFKWNKNNKIVFIKDKDGKFDVCIKNKNTIKVINNSFYAKGIDPYETNIENKK
jgi:hypothetical protein